MFTSIVASIEGQLVSLQAYFDNCDSNHNFMSVPNLQHSDPMYLMQRP